MLERSDSSNTEPGPLAVRFPVVRKVLLKAHLKLVHGIYVEDVKDNPKSLAECHDEDHERRFGRWLLDHYHEG